MENASMAWEIEKWASGENKSEGSGLFERGFTLRKKILVAGIVISSAPILLPPFVSLSMLGFAFSVPLGFFFATYACTEKLMSKLLPLPDPSAAILDCKTLAGGQSEIVYDGVEAIDDGGCGDGWDAEEDENEIFKGIRWGAQMEAGFADKREREPGREISQEEDHHGTVDINKDKQVVEVFGKRVDEEGYMEDDEDNFVKEGRPEHEQNRTCVVEGEGQLMERSRDDPLEEVRKLIIEVSRNEKDLRETENVKVTSVEVSESEERITGFQEEKLEREMREVVEPEIWNDGNVTYEVAEGERRMREIHNVAKEGDEKICLEIKKQLEVKSFDNNVNDRGQLGKSAPGEGICEIAEESINAQAKRDEGNFHTNRKELEVPKEVKGMLEGNRNEENVPSKVQAGVQTEGGSGASYGRRLVELMSSEVKDERKTKKGKKSLAKHEAAENIAATAANRSSQLETKMQKEITLGTAGHKGIELLGLHIEACTLGLGHAKTAEEKKSTVPFNEALLSEEKIWEQLNAMRAIVGYRGTPRPTCFEELKALYLFTGVEAPASFEGFSDLADVNDNLHYLMCIVGVK